MKKAAESGFVGLADDGECGERIAGQCYRAISVPDGSDFLEMACVTQLYKVLFGIGAFDACVRDVF